VLETAGGGGAEEIVSVKSACPAGVKFAITFVGALIVKSFDDEVPLRAPPNPENWYPLLGTAVTLTAVPCGYQVSCGLTLNVPPPAGLADVVSWYCGLKVAT
jgi:hypothetical protein